MKTTENNIPSGAFVAATSKYEGESMLVRKEGQHWDASPRFANSSDLEAWANSPERTDGPYRLDMFGSSVDEPRTHGRPTPAIWSGPTDKVPAYKWYRRANGVWYEDLGNNCYVRCDGVKDINAVHGRL